MMVKVFALTDALGGVHALSSAQESPGEGWVEIDAGDAGDPKYGQAHLCYTEQPLVHPALMAPRYRVEGKSIRERTEAELAEAVAALPAPEPDPMALRIAALEEELLVSYLAQAELYEKTLAQESENLTTMLAVAEIYEKMLGGN